MRPTLLACLLAAAGATTAQAQAPVVEKPAALVADGIPAVPAALADVTRPYMEFRTATFEGWSPVDRSSLILTRFGNTPQIHAVKTPGRRARS